MRSIILFLSLSIASIFYASEESNKDYDNYWRAIVDYLLEEPTKKYPPEHLKNKYVTWDQLNYSTPEQQTLTNHQRLLIEQHYINNILFKID